jgi:hypothetical protein
MPGDIRVKGTNDARKDLAIPRAQGLRRDDEGWRLFACLCAPYTDRRSCLAMAGLAVKFPG